LPADEDEDVLVEVVVEEAVAAEDDDVVAVLRVVEAAFDVDVELDLEVEVLDAVPSALSAAAKTELLNVPVMPERVKRAEKDMKGMSDVVLRSVLSIRIK
jgi:hypothetical protein